MGSEWRRLMVFEAHCRHSWIDRDAGPLERRCDLGKDVRALVGGDDVGWGARMPCLGGKFSRPGLETVPCEDYSPPTPEEYAHDCAQNEAEFARVMAGWCPDHGVRLVKRGRAAWCPVEGCNTGYRGCRSSDMDSEETD